MFSRTELEYMASLCIKHDILCISDEVYDKVVFEGNEHVRIASLPGRVKPGNTYTYVLLLGGGGVQPQKTQKTQNYHEIPFGYWVFWVFFGFFGF